MELITQIVAGLGEFFGGIIETFGSVGALVFKISEAGAVTGLTGFGWVLASLIVVGLGTWLFSKGLGLVTRIGKSGK